MGGKLTFRPQISPAKMYVCIGFSAKDDTVRSGSVLPGSDPLVRNYPQFWFERDLPKEELFAEIRRRFPDMPPWFIRPFIR